MHDKKCLLVVYILHIYAWIHIFSSDLCSAMLEAQRHLSSIQAEKYITNNLVPCAVHKKTSIPLKLPAFHICIGRSGGRDNHCICQSLLGSCHWYETIFSISSSIDPCSWIKTKVQKWEWEKSLHQGSIMLLEHFCKQWYHAYTNLVKYLRDLKTWTFWRFKMVFSLLVCHLFYRHIRLYFTLIKCFLKKLMNAPITTQREKYFHFNCPIIPSRKIVPYYIYERVRLQGTFSLAKWKIKKVRNTNVMLNYFVTEMPYHCTHM